MDAILISNNDPPITYTPNSFLILLEGAEIPPSVSDFDGLHTTTGDSLIIPSNNVTNTEKLGGSNV
jgi:hypothetical protein